MPKLRFLGNESDSYVIDWPGRRQKIEALYSRERTGDGVRFTFRVPIREGEELGPSGTLSAGFRVRRRDGTPSSDDVLEGYVLALQRVAREVVDDALPAAQACLALEDRFSELIGPEAELTQVYYTASGLDFRLMLERDEGAPDSVPIPDSDGNRKSRYTLLLDEE